MPLKSITAYRHDGTSSAAIPTVRPLPADHTYDARAMSSGRRSAADRNDRRARLDGRRLLLLRAKRFQRGHSFLFAPIIVNQDSLDTPDHRELGAARPRRLSHHRSADPDRRHPLHQGLKDAHILRINFPSGTIAVDTPVLVKTDQWSPIARARLSGDRRSDALRALFDRLPRRRLFAAAEQQPAGHHVRPRQAAQLGSGFKSDLFDRPRPLQRQRLLHAPYRPAELQERRGAARRAVVPRGQRRHLAQLGRRGRTAGAAGGRTAHRRLARLSQLQAARQRGIGPVPGVLRRLALLSHPRAEVDFALGAGICRRSRRLGPLTPRLDVNYRSKNLLRDLQRRARCEPRGWLPDRPRRAQRAA